MVSRSSKVHGSTPLVLAWLVASCASNVSPGDAASRDVAVPDESADVPEVFDTADVVDSARSLEPVEGYIEAITRTENGLPAGSSIDAHFYRVDHLFPCRYEVVDFCTVRYCDRTDSGAGVFDPVSAGDLTSRDDVHPESISLPFRSGSMDYASASLGADYWPEHATIRFDWSGDVVAPYWTQVYFPRATSLVGFSPEYDSRSAVVDRSRDMTLNWAPAFPVGQLVVTVSVSTIDGSAQLVCRLDGTRSTMTITAEQLSRLPATGPDAGFLEVAAVDEVAPSLVGASGAAEQIVHVRAGYVLFASSAGTR